MPVVRPLNTIDERTYAPLKIAAMVKALVESGVPAQDALAGTGLQPAMISDAATRTSIRQFLTVCRNAMGLQTDLALPFRVGSRMRVSSYGMYGYALMCCGTMRDAYQVALEYHQLATPLIAVRWREDAETASWIFPDAPEVALPDLSAPLYRFILEMQFAIHVTLHKDVMGPACLPCKALVAGPAPAHAALYREFLGCPVSFGGTSNELHYPVSLLDHAPQLANPITAATLSDTCARLLAECKLASGLTGQVYRELMRSPGTFPGIDDVAHALHVTARTLHRKLQAEGTSYQRMLTDVRCSLAVDYLRDTKLGMDDIASALGFSDSAGFRHAFKRWTFKNPSDYRRGSATALMAVNPEAADT